MRKSNLSDLALRRLTESGLIESDIDGYEEIVVFGSMSVGLQRVDSDLDLLCIGRSELRTKNRSLDLIVLSPNLVQNSTWLTSELGSHIAAYGTWLRGAGGWRTDACIGSFAIQNKRRRISAFMRALERCWFSLDECFRVKFAKKIRRETQRLLMMERGLPVPPTKIIDVFWHRLAETPDDIVRCLICLAPMISNHFAKDLLNRIDGTVSIEKGRSLSRDRSIEIREQRSSPVSPGS
jgi:predicted nucleotidyltransferase